MTAPSKPILALAALIALLTTIGLIAVSKSSPARALWTDTQTIRVPAKDAPIRQILWTPAQRLTTGVSGGGGGGADESADQYEPRVSADGATLILVKRRPGSNADLFTSRWTPDGWSTPTPIDAVNTDHDELGPELSRDNKSLYFYSDRPGGLGGYDLWVARADGASWGTPVNLGPAVNSAANEYGPALSPDGSRLYFSSNRPRDDEPQEPAEPWKATLRERHARHDYDLYCAPLHSGEPQPAAPVLILNTPRDEGAPAISPAGDFLYFASDRPGGLGGFDLYRARLIDAVPQLPENLGAAVNTESSDLDPSLSSDGFRLSFSSDRAVDDKPADHPIYRLWWSTSREVILQAPPSRSLAELWSAIWPWLLLLLLTLLPLYLLSRLLRDAHWRRRFGRLSLLAQCLLISLMIHAIIASMLAAWKVGRTLINGPHGPGGTQVALVSSGADSGLGEQLFGTGPRSGLPVTPLALLAAQIPAVQPDAPPSLSVNPAAAPATPEPRPLALATPDAKPAEQLRSTPAAPGTPDASTITPAIPASIAAAPSAAESAPNITANLVPASTPAAPSLARLTPVSSSIAPISTAASRDTSSASAIGPNSTGATDGSPSTPATPAATPAAPAADSTSARLPTAAAPVGDATTEPTASVPRSSTPGVAAPAQDSSSMSTAPTIGSPSIAPASTAGGASTSSFNAASIAEATPGAPAGPTTIGAGPVEGVPSSPAAAPAIPSVGPARVAPTAEPTAASRGHGLSPGLAVTAPTAPNPAATGTGRAAPLASFDPAPGSSAGKPAPAAARGPDPFGGSPSSPGPSSTPGPAGGVPGSDTTAAPGRDDGIAGGTRLPETPPEPVETFTQRAPEIRNEILEKMGGSAETERAVARALDWLDRHQQPAGNWTGRHFDDACGQCHGQAQFDADAAMTGMALLCYLGAGHTHLSEGAHQQTVAKAIKWLVNRQDASGDLRRGETMYGQTVATVALCEAYSMTKDPQLAMPVRRAVSFVLNTAAKPRTATTRDEDTSVLGWLVMTIESARRAGIAVPDDTFRSAAIYLDYLSSRQTPGLYASRKGEPVSPAMTAEAMFVQQLLGHTRAEPRMQQSATFILRDLPHWGDAAPTYHWYYATLALFQHQGDAWKEWNAALTKELLAHQHTTGNIAGTWDPQDEWSKMGGRIYQTAVCTLSLEVYYRYKAK